MWARPSRQPNYMRVMMREGRFAGTVQDVSASDGEQAIAKGDAVLASNADVVTDRASIDEALADTVEPASVPRTRRR